MALCFHHYLCQLYMALLLQPCLMTFFRFVVIMEQLALKLMELIFSVSMWFSCSWSASYSILWIMLPPALLHLSLKWFILLHLAHFFPYAGHHLGGWLEMQYLHFPNGHFNSNMWFHSIFLLFVVHISSKSFNSLRLFITTAWALWVSILFVNTSTHSLVTSVFHQFQLAL